MPSQSEDSNDFHVGDSVTWKWGQGRPTGEVGEVVKEGKATVTSAKGNEISRNAREGDPAIIIHREGNDVVKLAHELDRS